MENDGGTVTMENDGGTVTMENDVVVGQDGTVMDGITYSDLEKYLTMYSDLSIPEMVHILDTYGSFDKDNFEFHASCLDGDKKHEKKYGKPASFATSLFMLISVRVKPKKSSSLSVCGEITTVSGYHANESYIYKREWQNAENISGSDHGGYLTLNGPSHTCSPEQVHFLLQSRKLSIKLYHGSEQDLLIGDDIILDYSEGGFEHVKDRVVENNEINLTLKYVSIPIALYGRLAIDISPRKLSSISSNSVHVRGKVVAKYRNTLGNYESEEIVLFDKNPGQYERVSLDSVNVSLPLQRDWVAAPAYSLLHLRIDLFDSEEKSILAKDVELETDYSYRSEDFISDKYLISVYSRWFNTTQPPGPDGRDHQICGSLKQWALEPAIEVFSVLVCCGECMPLQIHGRLQFNTTCVTKDFVGKGFEIFKREKEVPSTLVRRGDAIPLLNVGSRSLCNSLPVSLICELKETTVDLNIKGYQIIREYSCLDRHLCAVFRGDNGFAAVHFSIFRSVVEARLVEVFVYHKGSQCAVSGSIRAQYEGFGYSSQYEKDWYSIVFFKKGREELVQTDAVGSIPLGGEDLVQMDADGSIPLSKFSIPLSRTSFVVPSYSSSRFHLDLEIGTEIVRANINVESYTPTMSFEGKECKLEFVFDWGDEEK